MKREFIVGLGGAAVWPMAARAQQSNMPVVGFLNTASEKAFANLVRAFRDGLAETGYVKDRSVLTIGRMATMIGR